MIHPIRRIHAWITGIHAWYYLGSADYMESLDEDEWITPGYAAREERPSLGERVEGSLMNELRHMDRDARHLHTSDFVPDTDAVLFAGIPSQLHGRVFGTPERLRGTMQVIDDV